MKRILHFAAACSFLFLGCKKDSLPKSEKRLRMIHNYNSVEKDTTHFAIFKYDSQGRLITIKDSVHSWAQIFTYLSYDAEGKLFKTTEINPWFPYFSEPYTVNYRYADNGHVKELDLNWNALDIDYFGKRALTYDASGRLISDSFLVSGIGGHSYTSIQYDFRGNIEYYSVYDLQSGDFTTYHAVYSTRPNPYKPFGLNYYFLRNDINVLNNNEQISLTTSWGHVRNFSYEYYPDGLVKKVTTTSPAWSYMLYREFFYE